MMSANERAAAAKRAWETIRARKAAGVYAVPKAEREEKVGPVIKPPDFSRVEVGARFWVQRTDCRWQNARFQGLSAAPVAMVSAAEFKPVAVAAAAAVSAAAVDRRQLQAPDGGKMFAPIFPAAR